MALATTSMEWVGRSIGEGMHAGRLPHVPEARTLEQSLFPVRLHPQHACLHGEFFSWARSFLRSSEKELEKMHCRAVASLPCYLWPNTSDPQRSLTLIKLMHWFTLVDEAVDEGAGLRGDAPAVERLCKGLVQELLAVGTSSSSEVASLRPAHVELDLQQLHAKPVVVTVGLEWWEAVQRADMPHERKTHLTAELTDFLMAQVDITRFRANLLRGARQPPTVEEYIITRRTASAFPLGLAMIEYDMGDRIQHLDEKTINSPLLQQLRNAVSDQACWLNDIISFPKEFHQGDILSLLPLLHMRNNAHCPDPNAQEVVPFRMAVAQAWEMTAARERDCARLAQQILDSPHLGGKPGLQEYVETMCSFTSGNWAWSLECPAYNNLQLHIGSSHHHEQIHTPRFGSTSSHDGRKIMMMNVGAPRASSLQLLLRKPSLRFVTTRVIKSTKRALLHLPPRFTCPSFA